VLAMNLNLDPVVPPWVNISQINAKSECQSIGAHLITEDEWLTIVRNIELQPANWSSGQIGSGYIPRGNSDSDAAMDGTEPLTDIHKRTLTLSNGATIWDIAGNVFDWTDATILGKDQPQGVANPTDFAYYQYSNLYSYGALSPERLLPLNPAWNTNQGYGQIYTKGVLTDMATYAFYRSGYWIHGARAGVLALTLLRVPGDSINFIGFRCAR